MDTQSIDANDTLKPLCPLNTFESAPKCNDIFPSPTVFGQNWEITSSQLDNNKVRVGIDRESDLELVSGSIVEMDDDHARLSIKPEDGSSNIEIRFLYKSDEAYQRVSINDVVTVSKVDGWSILAGPDYRIATYEMRANSLDQACLNAPKGFVRARLVPACQEKLPDEYELGCPQTQLPVRIFGLELSNEENSTQGNQLETIEMGAWKGILGIAAQLRAGSTPICERSGVYATVILVGPK